MSEKVDMKKAKEVFNTLIKMMDNLGLHYEKDEEKLVVKGSVVGDDLPIGYLILVRPENQIVQFISPMPFHMPEDKRVDGAIAVSVANYGLIDGSFDYDLSDGEIRFRLTSSYRESTLSEDLFEYMVMVSAATIDGYNDRFFMLAKGLISIQEFIEQAKAD